MTVQMIPIAILLPIFAGIAIMLTKFKKDKSRDVFVLSAVILNAVIALALVISAPKGQFVIFNLAEDLPIALAADGMSRFYAGLVSFLWPLATLYAFEYMEHEHRTRQFLAYYTMTFGVTLGVAFAGNIITLYLFYELLTLVTLPLVIHTMTKEAKRATRKYLYYMLGGAAFAFIGIVYYVLNSTDLAFTFGGNLDAGALAGQGAIPYVIFTFAFFGFGVKAAIFPFHDWLIDASVAPTPVTALLHAVAVVKSGVFAVGRITYYCYGYEFFSGSWVQYFLMVIAMITIVYGSSMGLREDHLKRRLAYSTIANLSYILLAFATMSPLGFVAGLTHIFCHAFMKICAFFCAGSIMVKTEKHYVSEIGGLGYKMPKVFIPFFVSALAMPGMPLMAGFISKWQIADALFAENSAWGNAGVLVLLYSAILTAMYMFTIIVKAYFPEEGYKADEVKEYKDPSYRMALPLAIFAIVTILVGVYAKPLLDYINGIIV